MIEEDTSINLWPPDEQTPADMCANAHVHTTTYTVILETFQKVKALQLF